MAQGPSKNAGVIQPKTIPGTWNLSLQPFPPMGVIEKMPAADKPVYGLYVWRDEYREHRESIKKVGWKSVRFGGPLDDEAMRMLAEDGMELMYTLGGRGRPAFSSDSAFSAGFLSDAEKTLRRYGPGGAFFKENPGVPNMPLRYVEIWNEPNFQYMIPDREPRGEVEAEREALYAKLLPAAYAFIKKGWPDVQVVGFGAGGASAGDVRFIDHVHNAAPAIASSYDILSTHPYVDPGPPDADKVEAWGTYSPAWILQTLRSILAMNYGIAKKPVWYTEVGWAVSQKDGGYFKTEGQAGDHVTPLLQAAYVCRMYAMAMRLGVGRVHIMFATDTDNYNAGFFLRDKSWRPSAYAVETMVRLLPDPRLVEVISDGKDGYYAYRFAADKKNTGSSQVIMAWNVAGVKKVEIPVKVKQVVVHDMLGQTRNAAVSNNKLSVDIGPCPVYIQ